jgi:phospholipid/cholesterol/gamma-HCH transport system ATP-binding protein
LADGRVIAHGPLTAMLASDHPWLRAYFHGVRARAIVKPEVSGLDAPAMTSDGS